MKKILICFIYVYLFFNTNANSDTPLKWNQTYSGGEIIINEIKFDLPEGEWLLLSKKGFMIRTIRNTAVLFVKEENGILKELIELQGMNSSGNYIAYVDIFYRDNLFSSDTQDGCRDQIEYYYVKVKTRSASFNCFVTRHEDVKKELNVVGSMGGWGLHKPFNTSWLRKWIRDNDIVVPDTMLTRDHYFYDKSQKYHYAGISHSINPELFGGPKTKFRSEEKSEYHRYNIEDYPKVKKYMNNFVKSSAIKHKKIEDKLKAKKNFRINFDELNLQNVSINSDKSKDIVEQLRNLKILLDDGVLSKEEFELAKKKLLN